MSLRRPDSEEHAPYYGLYIRQAPEGNILEIMARELEETRKLLDGLPETTETHRYAPDKWSIREIVGHLIDTEWTFTYRGLCFARADPAALPPFDQDLWARTSNAAERPLCSLLDELSALRQASLAIFRSFTDLHWSRTGVASGCPFTVRCMPYILAGHERHHRNVLVERYLS